MMVILSQTMADLLHAQQKQVTHDQELQLPLLIFELTFVEMALSKFEVQRPTAMTETLSIMTGEVQHDLPS